MDSQHCADELIPPKWMNIKFFEKVLGQSKPDEIIQISNYSISPASTKGDNYASVMFRVYIEYFETGTKNETSLIVKTVPEDDGMKSENLINSNIFNTEMKIYQDVIPKFEKMLRDIGDDTVLAPKMIFCSTTPTFIIVLEDISKQGFIVIPGTKLATIDEFKMAIEKLSKFHACSYVINEQYPGYFNNFANGLYNLPGLSDHILLGKGLERLTKLAKIEPDLQKYANILEQIQVKILRKSINTYKICKTKSKLKVLCHGDLHLKNLMYRYDSNDSAVDVLLLDFQTCIWSSMAVDVIYSMYLMSNITDIIQHEDELIQYYFEKFEENLKQLKFNGTFPTFSDYKEDLDSLVYLHLFVASTFMIFIVLVLEKDNIDPDGLNESNTDEEWYMNLYKTKTYLDMIKPLMEQFSKKGYWDILLKDDD